MKHSIYHLGSGRNHSTAEVAETIRKAVPGINISIGASTDPWTRSAVMRGPPSCKHMKKDFGFVPTFTLETAIADFAEWMRANPKTFSR